MINAELCKKNVIKISQVQKGASQNNDEAAIIVLDGTYIYIQKSAGYAFQRMSFSMHFDVTHTLINVCVWMHALLCSVMVTGIHGL